MARTKKDANVFCGTGRRKSSIARVRLMSGKGVITINNKSLDEYLPSEILKTIVKQPLNVTSTEGKFDVIIKVEGGGLSGQAGAIRHGIARALVALVVVVICAILGITEVKKCFNRMDRNDEVINQVRTDYKNYKNSIVNTENVEK